MDVSKIKYVNGVTANIKDTVARQRIGQIAGTFANKSHSHEYTDIVNAPWTNDDFANIAYELANTALNVAMTVEGDLFVHALNNTAHMSQAGWDTLNNHSEKLEEYDSQMQSLANFTTDTVNNCIAAINAVDETIDEKMEEAKRTLESSVLTFISGPDGHLYMKKVPRLEIAFAIDERGHLVYA